MDQTGHVAPTGLPRPRSQRMQYPHQGPSDDAATPYGVAVPFNREFFCAAGFASNDIFAERPDLGPPVNGDPIRLEAAASTKHLGSRACGVKSRAAEGGDSLPEIG